MFGAKQKTFVLSTSIALGMFVFGCTTLIVEPIKNDSTIEGLIAYYPFNGNAKDESENGNDGTLYGPPKRTIDRFGRPERAYEFDGIDDYILIPSSNSLNIRDSLTISAWVRFQVIPDSGSHILMKSKVAGTYEYGFSLNSQHSGALSASIGGNNVVEVDSKTVSVDTWYHIAATWRYPGECELYLDGAKNDSVRTIGNIDPNICELTIGRIRPDENRNSYGGIVDDIRIYNRILTESEIKNLYHEGGWKR